MRITAPKTWALDDVLEAGATTTRDIAGIGDITFNATKSADAVDLSSVKNLNELPSEKLEGLGNYSNTRIKLTPSSFTGVTGAPLIDYRGQSFALAVSEKRCACISIPKGMKATYVQVYADSSSSTVCNIYECDIDTGTNVAKGTGTFNQDINITDVPATDTNYIGIYIFNAGAAGRIVYGGYVTLAPI